MTFLRTVFFICLMFFSSTLFAQTADTVRHADTTLSIPPAVTDTPVIDTSIISIQRKTDTVQKVTPKPPSQGYVINGKVADMNTGEGIPFASVFFPHSSAGTSADLDGNFVLTLDKLPGDTLRMGGLGYKPATRILRKSQHDYNFIVELDRDNVALTEFVMHAGEDPAVVLMRHIIEHKPENNADKLENYRYEAYNRLEADLQRLTKSQFQKIPILKSYAFIFNNLDTVSETKPYLPLYLTETLSDFYFQAHPKKQREFVKASMVKV